MQLPPRRLAIAAPGAAQRLGAAALRVTRPASRLSRRRESETVMRIPTLVTVAERLNEFFAVSQEPRMAP